MHPNSQCHPSMKISKISRCNLGRWCFKEWPPRSSLRTGPCVARFASGLWPPFGPRNGSPWNWGKVPSSREAIYLSLSSVFWTHETCQVLWQLSFARGNLPYCVPVQEESGGLLLYIQVFCKCASGNRSPEISSCGTASWISFSSASVSFTSRAPMFSSKFFALVVPGMGTTSCPWCWSQARATWPAVACFLAPIATRRS